MITSNKCSFGCCELNSLKAALQIDLLCSMIDALKHSQYLQETQSVSHPLSNSKPAREPQEAALAPEERVLSHSSSSGVERKGDVAASRGKAVSSDLEATKKQEPPQNLTMPAPPSRISRMSLPKKRQKT